jgi:methyltransferase (TIGR00027 family)
MLRAAHLHLDGEPKILNDDLALALSGAGDAATLRTNLEALHAELLRTHGPDVAQALLCHLRAMAAVRSRYTEDELSHALQHGVGQYVILGAGLDSFAYRRQDLAGVVRVFEVDHPATQQWKRAVLRQLKLSLPPYLNFVPNDFERQTLMEGLQAEGYRSEAPAFFSWLGVVEYLTEEAVFKTLQEVAALAPGTEIVFEYALHESQLDAEAQQALAGMKMVTAARGEPFQSFFEPGRLATRVRAVGFAQVWDLGPEEANARYCTGRADGLRVLNVQHLMRARVGEV